MTDVKVSEQVAASADAVWELLGDFGGLQKLVPTITSLELEGDGVGAVRIVRMGDGPPICERLESFDAQARTLQYSITEAGPLPLANYLATIVVSEEGDGCRVDWSGTFDAAGASADDASALVQGIYTGGISAVRGALGV